MSIRKRTRRHHDEDTSHAMTVLLFPICVGDLMPRGVHALHIPWPLPIRTTMDSSRATPTPSPSALMTHHQPPLKILIVAHNASTVYGGEAVLPVHYFRGLRARGHSVNLIAHERNRDDLEAHFGVGCDALHFIPDTRLHRLIWRVGDRFPAKIDEALFGNLMNLLNEVYQKRLIRDLVSAGAVELIHEPMPVSPKAPSSIHGFGVPVIVGPMNGGMTWPDGYDDFQRRSERLFATLWPRAVERCPPSDPGETPGSRPARRQPTNAGCAAAGFEPQCHRAGRERRRSVDLAQRPAGVGVGVGRTRPGLHGSLRGLEGARHHAAGAAPGARRRHPSPTGDRRRWRRAPTAAGPLATTSG